MKTKATTPIPDPRPPKPRGRRPYRPRLGLVGNGRSILRNLLSIRGGPAYAEWLKCLADRAMAAGLAYGMADLVDKALAEYAGKIGHGPPPDRLDPGADATAEA